MALQIICNMCKKKLGEEGAVLISPPQDGVTIKFHLCRGCYKTIEKQLI
jgi:hypothetical protein